MIGSFKDRFFCIAYDLPGHNGSPYHADMIEAVRQEISDLKPICIGYSMGGRIALQIQDLLSAMVILSAHTGLTTFEQRIERSKIDDNWREKLLTLPFASFLSEWYAQPLFSTMPKQLLLKRLINQNPVALAQVMQQMSPSQFLPTVNFPCPALFIHGEEDWKYQQLYSKLPSTIAVRCIEKCGHVVHLENAPRCAQEINNWLEVIHGNT